MELLQVVGTLKFPSTLYTISATNDGIATSENKFKAASQAFPVSTMQPNERALCILPSSRKVAWCSGL